MIRRALLCTSLAWALGVAACDDSPKPSPAATAEPVKSAASAKTAPPSSAAKKESPAPEPPASAGAAASTEPSEAPRGKSAAAEDAPRKLKRAKKASGKQGDTEIKLLSAGSEPREKIRYVLSKGAKQAVDVIMSSAMSMELSGFKNPTQSMPDIKMEMDVEILSVAGDGTAKRKMTMKSVGLADESKKNTPMAKAVAKQMGALAGIVGHDTVSDRGIVLDARIDTSKIKDPQLKGMMDSTQRTLAQMGVAFPEEPIGVGAKWEAKTKVSQFGVELTQTATYELTELSGKRGKMKVKLDQSAPRGNINVPGVPKGTYSELVGMDSKGKGSIDFDLAKTVPKGKLEMKIRAHAKGELRGKITDVITNMTYKARFVPRG